MGNDRNPKSSPYSIRLTYGIGKEDGPETDHHTRPTPTSSDYCFRAPVGCGWRRSIFLCEVEVYIGEFIVFFCPIYPQNLLS